MADGTGKAGGGPPPAEKKGVSFTQKGNPDTGAPMRTPRPSTTDKGRYGG